MGNFQGGGGQIKDIVPLSHQLLNRLALLLAPAAPQPNQQLLLHERFPLGGNFFGRGHGRGGQLALGVLLNFGQPPPLLGGVQRQGNACAPRPPRAADAVHIHLGKVGNIEIKDMGDVVNVQPPRRHIGGDQNLDFAFAETAEHIFPCFLAQIAAECLGGNAPPR